MGVIQAKQTRAGYAPQASRCLITGPGVVLALSLSELTGFNDPSCRRVLLTATASLLHWHVGLSGRLRWGMCREAPVGRHKSENVELSMDYSCVTYGRLLHR